MNKMGLILLVVLLAACAKMQDPARFAGQITEYLTTDNHPRAEQLKEELVAAGLDPQALITHLQKGLAYGQADTGHQQVMLKNRDGKERGFGYYVPPGYDPNKKHPLVVWLHGGVMKPVPNRGREAYRALLPDSVGGKFIVASISGDKRASWFNPYGFANIRQGIRYLKRRYNIDPDRVYLGGVSDGATGCYFIGNLMPTIFAGFVVWSGFPGMLSMFKIPLHVENIRNRAWYVVHTGKDRLYPAETVRQYVVHFKSAGVDMEGTVYHNLNHDMGGFIETERPKVFKWMQARKRRDADTLEWSADMLQFSRFEWIEAEELADIGMNHEFPQTAFESSKLTVVNPKSSRVLAIRNGNEYRLFVRHIACISVLVNPARTDINQKIRIYVNGALLFNKKVTPDVGWMLAETRKYLDPTRVYCCKIKLNLE